MSTPDVIFLTVFWTWVACAILFLRNTILPKVPISQTPADFGLTAQTVRFRAADGVLLEGWKILVDASRPWILLCHGVGSNRADLLDVAAGLRDARFNLFLFDFRGHGGSTGRTTSFGWREQRDLEGALAFLGRQAEIPARAYGIYGISMGAAVALMVAARDERLGAVAVDSPYQSLEASLRRHMVLWYPAVPRVPLLWFVLATYRMRFGVWPSRVSPLRAIAQIAPRPVLLIQGSRDKRVAPEEARRLHAGAGTPKELWIVEGADHLGGFAQDPKAYQSRLESFFNSSLT